MCVCVCVCVCGYVHEGHSINKEKVALRVSNTKHRL